MRAFHLALCMILWIASEAQDTNYLPHGQYHPDIQYVVNVTGTVPGGIAWANSYSVGDSCYCALELKNGIAEYPFESPIGWMAVKDVCVMLGNGPGIAGNPIYNDVQCGNGPPNSEENEHTCPGRVDIGRGGCGQIGPTWNFGAISMLPEPPKTPTAAPPDQDTFFRDVGTYNEDTTGITGTSWVYTAPTTVGVKGTSQPQTFRSHRSGPNFSYLVEGLVANRRYAVSLGFAEVWMPNCETGKRVQSVHINGIVVNDYLDVFKEVGCATAHVENAEVFANGLGRITITIKAIKENAMLSTIKIGPTTSSSPPPPPPPPSPPAAVVIDVGSSSEDKTLFTGDTWKYGVATTPVIKGTSTPTYFRTHRSGKPLKYTVPGFTPGASYTVTLGFAEIWKPNCANGKRIMSIKLNDIIVSSNLDVFRAVGCETAYLENHVGIANAQGKFVIEIGASVENAMLSQISISSAPGRYFLDTGALGDNITMCQGKTSRYGNADTPEIGGTITPVRFRTNRFGSDFKYVIESGFTPGKAYKVSLCFSEIYSNSCSTGARKFSIAINGQAVENALDVAGTTGGCNRALVKLYTIKANAQGKFEIAFKAGVNNAMVSCIDIQPS